MDYFLEISDSSLIYYACRAPKNENIFWGERVMAPLPHKPSCVTDIASARHISNTYTLIVISNTYIYSRFS